MVWSVEGVENVKTPLSANPMFRTQQPSNYCFYTFRAIQAFKLKASKPLWSMGGGMGKNPGSTGVLRDCVQ